MVTEFSTGLNSAVWRRLVDFVNFVDAMAFCHLGLFCHNYHHRTKLPFGTTLWGNNDFSSAPPSFGYASLSPSSRSPPALSRQIQPLDILLKQPRRPASRSCR